MPSFRISVTPSRRAAARFIMSVRRTIQKALAEEEKKRGLKQTDIARAIGVHRSVINRELKGRKDITLGRVAELAWAMGRVPVFDLPVEEANIVRSNLRRADVAAIGTQNIVPITPSKKIRTSTSTVAG